MRFTLSTLLAVLSVLAFSCKKDDPIDSGKVYRRQVYNYSFNKGQVVGKQAYYNRRTRLDSMRATVVLEEQPYDKTMIIVSLFNAPVRTAFPVGILQADTGSYGYETDFDPNLFARNMTGTGPGSVITDSARSRYSFDYLTTKYDGYFVVKDPIAPDTALHIDTFTSAMFPVFGTFAR